MKNPSKIVPHEELQSSVKGVALHRLRRIHDPRGNLCAGEFAKEIPFIPRRFFVTYDVPKTKQRGEHAHKRCHQFLLCLSGGLTVRVDDGRSTQLHRLKPLSQGLYVPPGVWCSQFAYAPDTALLVFASHFYEASDYIRNYQAYLRYKKVHS